MTDVVVDASMDASLSDSITAALATIQSTGQLASIYNAGSARIVATTRLPDTATVTDPATGVQNVISDPAAIAAMITGPHAFVTAQATTVGSDSPVVFHWAGDAADGSPIDGSAVVWLGAGFTDGDAIAQTEAYYGMTTDVTLVRAIMDGSARSIADEAGGLRSTQGVDHGVAFASMVDGLVVMHANETYGLFERQGPEGYGISYGTTQSVLLNTSDQVSVTIGADGGLILSGSVDNDVMSFSWTRTMSAVGAQVLGETYERYDRNVVVSNMPLFQDDGAGSFTLSRAADYLGSEMGMAITDQLATTWFAVHDIDNGLNDLIYTGQADGSSAVALGQSLGLWGFGENLEFGHTRLVTLAGNREINVSDSTLSSGMQRIGGDVVYDRSGTTAFGTSDVAHVLAIDDRATTIDTIIVGSGGRDDGNGVSYTGSLDHIEAGSGSDLIVLGNGVDPDGLLRNVAHGNAGHDVIMGGDGDDEIFGDDGNDLVFASFGNDVVHGGAGFDILDATNIGGDLGIVYDARTGILNTEFGTTVVDGFERFMGSQSNDVIHAASGMVVDGGIGNDELHLEGIGIAIGGGGDDAYHIDVAADADGSFLLLGFDQGDTLWLNGTRHTGVHAVDDGAGGWTLAGGFGSSSDPNDYWSDEYVAAAEGGQSDLAMIRLQHHVAGSVVATTEIYLAGFNPGEGGITYDRIVDGQAYTSTDAGYDLHMTQGLDDVTALFKGPDYVPQHDMFGLV